MFKSLYSLVYIDDVDDDHDDADDRRNDVRLRRSNNVRSVSRASLNDGYDMTDDRASIYLDSISMASDQPPMTEAQQLSAAQRKALSMSRQTVYHSAEDLGPVDAATINSEAVTMTSDFLRHLRAGDDAEELQRLNVGNGTAKGSNGRSAVDGITAAAAEAPSAGNNEVPANGMMKKNSRSNKTVTYSEWKSRTWRRFADGQRTVDFVLAHPASDPHPRNAERRRAFEANLVLEGLQLEREETQHIHFVKVHAPQEVLCRYCEILKMRMPIKRVREQDHILLDEVQVLQRVKEFCGRPFDFVDLDKSVFPDEEYRLTQEFSRNHSYLFDEEQPGFFTQSISHAVVHFILERMRFSDDDETSNNVGIEKLLAEGIYEAAYPLHDGDCRIEDSQRNLLYTEWASLSKWIKHQPLDHIKEYFGVKVAMYFAWLGFYTHMLIPASVVGIICFLFGLWTLNTNTISEDICSAGTSIVMCPQCDQKCDYWYLSETCAYSRISHLFDNPFTVAFACFMGFWAVLYLELWKRYSAKLVHRWGCSDFSTQAEHPRPEYLSRLKSAQKKRFNVIHRVLEPHVPFWKEKFPATVLSYSVVFLFICLALAAVFGIVLYRMSLMSSRHLHNDSTIVDHQTYNMFVLPATAAALNLVIITVMNYVYDYLAVILTDMEFRRTQTEYDESLTLKIYLFQFVNYYSSIFYIAFLKGKFVGYPSKHTRIFGMRQEECSPGGCLMELCIQLVIIMVGKQVLNAMIEMSVPYITRRLQQLRRTWGEHREAQHSKAMGAGASSAAGPSLIACNQWTNDYKLLAWSSRGLFDEYLEMIIQFGFVTMFVVAFPLAPLFALLNNIFEMRLDAQKFLKYYRRPVPCRVKDIGVWFNIMAIISRISTATSAFIIAFSSNFIPRLVYMYYVSPDKSDDGYLNFTLASFNVTEFGLSSAPQQPSEQFANQTVCWFSDFRNSHTVEPRYKRGEMFWHVLAARLAFLVVFENVLVLVQMCVAWAIPDVPRKLSDQMKREDYLTRETIIEQEKLLSQTAPAGPATTDRLHSALQNDLFAGGVDLTAAGHDLLHRRAIRKAAATAAAASALAANGGTGNGGVPSVDEEGANGTRTTTTATNSDGGSISGDENNATQLTLVDEKSTAV